MIKAGIIGSTGYAGGELARLLLQRDDIEIKWYGSRSYIDQKYASIYQNMFRIVDDACMDDNMKELAEQVDVVFTATPQGLCASLMDEDVLSKVKVIDLSADFRIKDVSVYEKWYKLTHASPQFIGEAVYGLPEINREKVKKARLIANPGCFPTCSFLSTYPLVKEGLIDLNTLIIDAYNANPTSMAAALQNFRNMTVSHKMLILGDMRELGTESLNEHQKIVDYIKESDFEKVWLVGEQFASVCHSFKTYANVQEVIKELETNKPKGYTILIKGSNGIKLSSTVEYL